MVQNVLIGCHKLSQLIPQPFILVRALRPHPLRFSTQLGEALPRLRDHGLQLLMLFSPDGELRRDSLEFVMETARRLLQLINFSMQTINAPSQDEKWYQGRGQDQCRKDDEACPKRRPKGFVRGDD
jgi:hypothetical protein